MGKTRTFEVTATYRVTLDEESWATAYGVHGEGDDAVGTDMAEWVREAARDAIQLASDVNGSVSTVSLSDSMEVTSDAGMVVRLYSTDHPDKYGIWDEGLHTWVATPDHADVSTRVLLLATVEQPERYAVVLAAGKTHILVRFDNQELEIWHRSNVVRG